MKFVEFAKTHMEDWDGINYNPGMPGYVDICRLWSGLSILLPEKCEDKILYRRGTNNPELVPNPLYTGKKSKIVLKEKDTGSTESQIKKPVKKPDKKVS